MKLQTSVFMVFLNFKLKGKAYTLNVYQGKS